MPVQEGEYKKLFMYRKREGSTKSEWVTIGYWEAPKGPAIVRSFLYTDEHGHTTDFRNSNVIGQALDFVIRQEELNGFQKS